MAKAKTVYAAQLIVERGPFTTKKAAEEWAQRLQRAIERITVSSSLPEMEIHIWDSGA